jgi:hypothetical protein
MPRSSDRQPEVAHGGHGTRITQQSLAKMHGPCAQNVLHTCVTIKVQRQYRTMSGKAYNARDSSAVKRDTAFGKASPALYLALNFDLGFGNVIERQSLQPCARGNDFHNHLAISDVMRAPPSFIRNGQVLHATHFSPFNVDRLSGDTFSLKSQQSGLLV